MHLLPKISYETNFYYWIQALSGWSVYSGEKGLYDYYRQAAGQLTPRQLDNLEAVSKILKHSAHPRAILAELYKGNDSPASADSREILKLAESLRENFDAVWAQSKIQLEYHISLFEKLSSQSIRSSIGEVARFFDTSFDTKSSTTIFLLMNTSTGGAVGHAIRGNDFILLHPGGKDFTMSKEATLNTTLHEYMHLIEFGSSIASGLLKKSYMEYIEQLNAKAPIGYTWKLLYEEILVSIFANNTTGGYFRPDTYGKERPSESEMAPGFNKLINTGTYTTSNLINWISLKLLPEAVKYLKLGKKLDEDFVTKISKLILEIIINRK